jgi:hypothetical protein
MILYEIPGVENPRCEFEPQRAQRRKREFERKHIRVGFLLCVLCPLGGSISSCVLRSEDGERDPSSAAVIGAAIEVQKHLRKGLL